MMASTRKTPSFTKVIALKRMQSHPVVFGSTSEKSAVRVPYASQLEALRPT